MSVWPNTLPQSPLLEGFARVYRQNKISFQPEGGKSKDVLFFTAVPEVMNLQFVLNESQRQTFVTFYKTTTLFGTQYFTFTDPNTNQSISVRFSGEPPNISALSDRFFNVTFQLETLP